ncbi:MAG TPA: transcriptional regulator [Desulfovibrio sp.]|nr:transcriptional regulator [Desulfovibrio sp.]
MPLSEEMHKAVIKSGCAQRVADRVGKNYNVLLNELNPLADRSKAGADLLLPIMEVCKNVDPLHYLAERMGGVFIQLPEVPDCERDMINVVTEFGEFVATYGKAIEDKKLNPGEKKEISKEGYEAIAAIQGILCSL